MTGCAVIVNTSFNEDAFRCFMGTDIDILAVGNCYFEKSKQSESLKRAYTSQFELD